MHEAFGGLATEGKTTARGVPKNPLQLGATLWRFRHENRVTSTPIWVQNLISCRPLWALAKMFGVRPYYGPLGQPDDLEIGAHQMKRVQVVCSG
ncbi:MAG: hypothetical protein ACLPZR_18695 [Solirubrobacteraceae bacterium]|jgi:hypothetical protein